MIKFILSENKNISGKNERWEEKKADSKKSLRQRKEDWQRQRGRVRERERHASAVVIHLFCVCACLCGSVGGYRCQAAQFLLISTYSRNANNNSILTHSLEVTVLSVVFPRTVLCTKQKTKSCMW